MGSPTHLLDTNICSYLMRERPAQVVERMQKLGPNRLVVSVITALELREGAEMSSRPEHYHKRIDVFLEHIHPVAFPVEAAREGARIRNSLRRQGKPIGDFDSLIAAHARHLDLILVTNNMREFSRVTGLKVENWTNRAENPAYE